MGRALAITTKWLCVLSPLLAWMPEPAAAQGCEWARGFQSPGASDPLRALTVFDDGTGPALYAGGEFTTAGDVAANRIAKWDGTQWSALRSGMNGSVLGLAVFDDGTGPALYAGGEFTTAGGVVVNNIAKWEGRQWSALGGGTNMPVYALTVFDDGAGPALYAGGEFIIAGDIAANRIAKWDGTRWSVLGSGVNSSIRALMVFGDGSGPALYAGGEFTTADAIAANYIAKWDGMQWSAIGSGSGMSQLLSALTVFDNGTGPALYAGGNFSAAGSAAANYVARWDGIQWSALGSGVIGQFPYVSALTVFDDGSGSALYAGGGFTRAGGVVVNSIAKWNGTQWSALGSGVSASVNALTVFDDGSGSALYVGGGFSHIGGERFNFIAKWDGTQWSHLGSGMNGEFASVLALTVFDDGSGPALYAGGGFKIGRAHF